MWFVLVPVSILGWIVILVSGTHPRWMFAYVEGVMRWGIRVAVLLPADRYPPFRLSP